MQRLLEALPLPDRARTLLLTAAADPGRAAPYLKRLQTEQPDLLERWSASPVALQYAIVVFSFSQFLSEEILQNPEWIDEIAGNDDLSRLLSAEDLGVRLTAWLGPGSDGLPSPLKLAQFRRRQVLRVLLRDVQELCTLGEATEELANIAEAILDNSYHRIRAELIRRHGVPRYAAPDGEMRECGFSVLALGKLGGKELNYSSDIDLMFVYSANGETDGADPLTNKEFFKKVANLYTGLLSTYTSEGMCYRVDLRLRPDGSHGEVCISLEGAKAYYSKRARDWELQMLVKARTVAGERDPGRELLDFVEPLIYRTTLDFSAVESVSLTRERISEQLSKRRLNDGMNVKLVRGGIRDIEFLVQCLQRLHGGREPWIRNAGSLLALRRLCDKALLSDAEYSRLVWAYQFLRHLEHRLQMDEDRQTHTLPSNPEDLESLARRMPAREVGRAASADKLLHQLNTHLEEVQETYGRVIHSQQPLYYGAPPAAPEPPSEVAPPAPEPHAQSNLIRFLEQRAPGFSRVLAANPVRRSHRSFEIFLEKVYSEPGHLRMLEENPALARHVIDIFEHSPHFGEELIRRPERLSDVGSRPGELDGGYCAVQERLTSGIDLREFFKREMFRIQADSICLNTPIFETLGRTSDLADAVICAAYRLALDQVKASRPPQSASYAPKDQMMVIAMGRLGMREFDLGSDADLSFVIPDEDASEILFWTRVAERMIGILGAYTGDGVIFSVDSRLRPNGREGNLVQLVGAYTSYLEKNAEAWEGITYMKSRAVAGNADAAIHFLHVLQEVDWRRYGQSGRSRSDLRAMRARLEKEQKESNPLKAGAGGYYDIDFALMYLRLKGGGLFFKTLNTPERIDVIEKMGHLDHADAVFLLDAASLYRAIDHGLRVYSGHAEGKLPTSAAPLEALTNLVRRWTPDHLHDQPLPEELAQIRARTREFFQRLFG